MQKILSINARAAKRSLKKSRKATLQQDKIDRSLWHTQKTALALEERNAIKAERKARREDWIAGPLAANRDTGLNKGTLGGLSPEITKLKTKPLTARKESERPHYGNTRNIILGDRVCIIRGVDMGKIGEVTNIDVEDGRVTVGGLNKGDVLIPPTAAPEQRIQKFQESDIPLDLDDVRLVVKRWNPETGEEKDVIARFIEGGAPYPTRMWGSNLPKHTRYFAGTDERIDWPEEEIEDQQRHQVDTPRMLVRERTYRPSIQYPPTPDDAVADFLDERPVVREYWKAEYISGKIIQDARSEWYRSRRLVTPRQLAMEQLSRQERQEELSQARRAADTAT